jgi:hypothetical protein
MEMFIATLAHRHVFSYKEYQPSKNAAAKETFLSALAKIAGPAQFVEEVQDAVVQLTESSIQNVAPVSRTASGSLAGSI